MRLQCNVLGCVYLPEKNGTCSMHNQVMTDDRKFTHLKPSTEMTKLFGPSTAKSITWRLGATTIEELSKLNDKDILRVRGVGKIAIYKLRSFVPAPPPEPDKVQEGMWHEVVMIVEQSADDTSAIKSLMECFVIDRQKEIPKHWKP